MTTARSARAALPKAAIAIANVSCDWLIPADNPAMAPIMAAATNGWLLAWVEAEVSGGLRSGA
jgi:hypothetical protein